VVRDSAIKNKLADTAFGIGRSAGPNRADEALRNAPILIVACAELEKSGYYYGREPSEPATDKGDWFMFDVALAVQNLTLAAYSLGLGTVHVGAFNAKKAAEVLKVPNGYSVVELIPLGYPDEEPEVRPRKELSEIVFYDKFGQGQETVDAI
jgi:nitroreductase